MPHMGKGFRPFSKGPSCAGNECRGANRNQMMRLRIHFLAVLSGLALFLPVAGAGSNLLVNGDWKMCPPLPNPVPYENKELYLRNVAGSLRYFKTGDPALPGWNLIGKGSVFYWHDGRRNFGLLGKSSMSQTITTVPGKPYRVELNLTRNPEGTGHDQSIDIIFGDARTKIDPTAFRPTTYSAVFKATAPSTTVTFRSNARTENPTAAPYMFYAAVYLADPAVERAQPWFTNAYNKAARGYERAERQTIMELYTDAFSGTTEEGASFSKAELSSALDGVLDKEPSASASVTELSLSEDGSTAEVIVSQRINTTLSDSIGRHRNTAIATFRDHWVKDGEGWKLETRKLISRRLQVDGKDFKGDPPPAYP